MITVTVPGDPVPQGSLRTGGRGQLFYSNAAYLKPYRTAVATAVKEAAGEAHETWTGPVTVRVLFIFERPKSHLLKSGALRKGIAEEKLTPPDLDKLVRSILDAVTQSGVYADDSQVTVIKAAKDYGETACTHLQISEGERKDS